MPDDTISKVAIEKALDTKHAPKIRSSSSIPAYLHNVLYILKMNKIAILIITISATHFEKTEDQCMKPSLLTSKLNLARKAIIYASNTHTISTTIRIRIRIFLFTISNFTFIS